MKIVFVLPSVGRKIGEEYVDSWKMEPLSFATLAGITPPGIDIQFWDDRLEEIDYDQSADLAAINIETYTAKRAYYIAAEFRKRKIPVIMGGFHATLVSSEVMEHADSVVIGEAENLWPEIIEDAARGKLKKSYQDNSRSNQFLVNPQREIYTNKKYLPITLIETSRGCLHSCNFCSIGAFYQQTYKVRPIPDIVAEIKATGKKLIFFVDDNINVDFTRAKELYKALVPLNIVWFSQSTVNVVNDIKLLELMKKSGCLGLLIGFESLNTQNLSLMGKHWNISQMNYSEALKILREVGLIVYGTFVFGYENDDKGSIDEALKFAITNKLFLAAFNHLLPFPGTKIYDQFFLENMLLYDKWWLADDYRVGDVAFRPNKMTPQELSIFCFEARGKFYSHSSILKRLSGLKIDNRILKTLGYFVYINLFSGKEIIKRQGLALGETENAKV
ncbi:MAG: B12-binding domain-containing radical SAM protein [Elusimicrobia bacterium]|nr:B12-binding domain-containing radical SAM protein [Elusimicrobiota bacterium]